MAHDQLSVEMQNGRTLQGLAEAPVKFKPTYKYLKKHLSQYDPKRVPAWCDRIAYASAGSVTSEGYANVMSFVTSDHKPVRRTVEQIPTNKISSSFLFRSGHHSTSRHQTTLQPYFLPLLGLIRWPTISSSPEMV